MCTFTKVERYKYASFFHERVAYTSISIMVFVLVLFRTERFMRVARSVNQENLDTSIAVDSLYEKLFGLVDYTMLLHKDKKTLERYANRITLAPESLDNMKNALTQNKPIIFACSNFALFYLMTLAKEFRSIEDITFIKANDSAMRREFDAKLSEYTGVNIDSIVYNNNESNYQSTAKILRLLRDKKNIGCLVDIAAHNTQQISVNFLGREMAAPKSIYNLAVVTEAIIIPALVMREGMKYKLYLEPHIKPNKVKLNKSDIETEVYRIAQETYDAIGNKVSHNPNKWSSWEFLSYVRKL